MKIRKILLADDAPEIRDLCEYSLTRLGHWEVLLARSGQEAIALAAAERPDLILLDVRMPGLDGPATLAGLRERDATRDIPVVFLTASADPEERSQIRQAGALGIIEKPFDLYTLPGSIRALLANQPATEGREDTIAGEPG